VHGYPSPFVPASGDFSRDDDFLGPARGGSATDGQLKREERPGAIATEDLLAEPSAGALMDCTRAVHYGGKLRRRPEVEQLGSQDRV
jgi:hypothetical protein